MVFPVVVTEHQLDKVGGGREVQDRGYICMSVADSCWCKWLRCKESACNAGDRGFDPWVRKIL